MEDVQVRVLRQGQRGLQAVCVALEGNNRQPPHARVILRQQDQPVGLQVAGQHPTLHGNHRHVQSGVRQEQIAVPADIQQGVRRLRFQAGPQLRGQGHGHAVDAAIRALPGDQPLPANPQFAVHHLHPGRFRLPAAVVADIAGQGVAGMPVGHGGLGDAR